MTSPGEITDSTRQFSPPGSGFSLTFDLDAVSVLTLRYVVTTPAAVRCFASGVPSPVAASQPGPALNEPLSPSVMSWNPIGALAYNDGFMNPSAAPVCWFSSATRP